MPVEVPRCQVLPLPDHQVSFTVAGQERLRWHFGPQYPRPFFYPLIGPSGLPLTRIGHPGAPDHDHHRSIWFAHEKVQGVDFWSERGPARIRQKGWRCYTDGADEASMAVVLGWNDGHDANDLLEQDLFVGVRPGPEGTTVVELQTTLRPVAAEIELQATNFGLLAVRVAKSLSVHFGGGLLTSSTGATGEKGLFQQPAAWMDYSGPMPGGVTQGITYFDHPHNPNYPARWHVRSDGWMGASLCRPDGRRIRRAEPLTLRYLLHAHRGGANGEQANALASRVVA
jgi:hypothetical protein